MNHNAINANLRSFRFSSSRSIKLIKSVFALSLLVSSTACVGSADEFDVDGNVAEESQALGAATRVVGDTACPSEYSLATPEEAEANRSAICNQMGAWDIARLAGGGSMDGPGYGCGIHSVDTRSLGQSVCKKPVNFARGVGDGVCPSGYTLANPMVARAHAAALCAQLGTWDIARLAGGGSMDGPGYGCTIRDSDSRGLGHSACTQLNVTEVGGDNPCPAGTALISPQEARTRQSELCSQLGPWDIARLDGGGSMDGAGYGCTIRDSDSRTLGHALCGAL